MTCTITITENGQSLQLDRMPTGDDLVILREAMLGLNFALRDPYQYGRITGIFTFSHWVQAIRETFGDALTTTPKAVECLRMIEAYAKPVRRQAATPEPAQSENETRKPQH